MILLYGPEALVQHRLADDVELCADPAEAGYLVVGGVGEDLLQHHVRQQVQVHCLRHNLKYIKL